MFDNAEALCWICWRLGIDIPTLKQALDERNAYRRVFIPKRGPKDRRKGRKRVLHVPPETLKQVQRRIHEVLLRPFKWPSPVHGFVSRRSHLTAAARHIGQSALLTIDFKNAFDHLRHFQVYRVFVTRLHPDPRVAFWLGELAMHRRRLPQGAPSSPLIFNLVALDLDAWLSGFAKERGYTYTRYSDEVAVASPRSIPFGERMEIIGACRRFGFRIAPEKVRYQETRWGALELTNVLVRPQGLGLSKRRVIDRIRALAHRAISDPSVPPETIAGKIGWVSRVDPTKLHTRLRKPIQKLRRLGVLS